MPGNNKKRPNIPQPGAKISTKSKKEQAGEYETEARAEYHKIMFIQDPTQRRASLSAFFVKLYALIRAYDHNNNTDFADDFMNSKNALISNEIEYEQQEIANQIGWELIDDRYNIHVPATVGSFNRSHQIFERLQDRSINESLFDLVGEMMAFLEIVGIFAHERKSDADRYRLLVHTNTEIAPALDDDDGGDE